MEAHQVERGPAKQGNLAVETRGLEPVPDSERHGPTWRIFTVWFSANMVPPTFFIGTLAAADFIQLGFASGLCAIVLGNLIGASIVGLTATMGPRTGMPQLALGRMSFGKANVLPATLNWAGMIAWTAVDTFFGASAFSLLTGLPFWVGALSVTGLMAVLVVIGYEAILTYQKYIAGILSAVFAVVALRVFVVGDFTRPDGVVGADRIGSFILMTTVVAAFALSWCVFGSDYTRYLPRTTPQWKVFCYASGGLALACMWLQILGLAVAGQVTGSGVGTIRDDVLGGGFIGALAMLAVFFGIVSVNALNTYTGSLSLLTIGVRMSRPAAAVVAAVLALVLAIWLQTQNFADAFSNYLLMISYWIAPFAAVVLTDWWLRGRNGDVEHLCDLRSLHTGWQALSAFLLGIVASIPFMSTALYVGSVATALFHSGDVAYYVGFITAGLTYALLQYFSRRSGRSRQLDQAQPRHGVRS